jgi:hypothetical protein
VTVVNGGVSSVPNQCLNQPWLRPTTFNPTKTARPFSRAGVNPAQATIQGMRTEVIAVLVIALVVVSAGAGYYVGFYMLRPDEVQVRGKVSLFSNNRCCIAPTYVRFFYVVCHPESLAPCAASFNSTLSQLDGLGYAYSVTVPNGHQYIINPGVQFSNGTEIGCTASFIPIYSYSQTLNYNVTSSC